MMLPVGKRSRKWFGYPGKLKAFLKWTYYEKSSERSQSEFKKIETLQIVLIDLNRKSDFLIGLFLLIQIF